MTETGVPALDDDHRFLKDMLSGLAKEALSAADPGLLEDMSLEAASSLESHFAKEERMLAEAFDPLRQAHADLHGELLDRLARMNGSHLAALGPNAAHEAILSFIAALEDEIRQWDQPAGPAILGIQKPSR